MSLSPSITLHLFPALSLYPSALVVGHVLPVYTWLPQENVPSLFVITALVPVEGGI